MRAGGMRYRLQLLKPERVTDIYGAENIRYMDQGTIHAERVAAQGFKSDENGEHFADYRVQFNVRSVFHVEENWRVKQVDGYLYTVVAIVPNKARQFNTIILERVNE